MNYSNSFYGWLGKTAMDFTYSNIHTLTVQLANYYKENSSTGQKLMIGYDSRFLAKDFADFVSTVMASKGIKVFLSNRIVPSSVLLFSSLQKKSMGTLVLTGDECDASFLGLRAFDINGKPLNERAIGISENKKKKESETFTFSVKKWVQKGFIEPFDPTICFKKHLENEINFDSMVPSANFIMFNPLFGSGSLYFDQILTQKSLHGYTVNNDHSVDMKGIEPLPSHFKGQIYEDMLVNGAEFGFIVSPDCSIFEFLIGSKVLKTEEIIFLLVEHLMNKKNLRAIILSNAYDINDSHLNNLGVEIKYVDDEKLPEEISLKNHLLAVDNQGRFYFDSHGAPDALMVGYYLCEILNNKLLSSSTLQRKLEAFDSLIND